MSFEVPDELRYEESHEWITVDESSVRVGITDFAQDELGDVVFVELPAAGDTLEQGDDFGIVESIKAVSDVYAPVSGEVTGVNEDLFDRPELINEEPFEGGWLIEIAPADTDQFDDLLSAEEYREQIA